MAGSSDTIYLNCDPSGTRAVSSVRPHSQDSAMCHRRPRAMKGRRGLCSLPPQPRLCGTWSSAKRGAVVTKLLRSWGPAVGPLSTGCVHSSALFHVPVVRADSVPSRSAWSESGTSDTSWVQRPEGYMHALDSGVTHTERDCWVKSLMELVLGGSTGRGRPASACFSGLQGS